ncbi:hypothetical protein TRIATDRAFT_299320 [Trichoderma atroviride IMI 206040]|uniref:Uncharacterized protein n=1 Tax=Hypocrea atroviridis (strain ATCC 20476 / IMI 206040) TaxID=452589 RepID=G9NU72_HYPAI|nr:uncharacterized protein TRIATDRAFT_299320 [Trichoderma atroviride IMI 206040]EHK45605.1 hypothetical protein TRIATDRAFT_299320 [Trichoderma atroviride IMI 206040]
MPRTMEEKEDVWWIGRNIRENYYLILRRGMRHDYMFRDVYGELKSEHKNEFNGLSFKQSIQGEKRCDAL